MKEQVIKLRKEGKTIPEICSVLNIGKGTVGYHLKGLNIKILKKRIKRNIDYNSIKRKNILDKIDMSIDMFIKELKNSNSILDFCRRFKVSEGAVKRLAKKHNCFPEKRTYNKNKSKYNFDLILKGEEILLNPNRSSKNNLIKNYLFKNDIKEYKCEECEIKEWNNKPISLELDHIDGNRNNNKLENLRILCPNCHSQTDTFRAKNIKKK